MAKKKQLWGWKWKGVNEFVPGLPARDIELAEAERRGWVDLIKGSPLYAPSYRTVKEDSE